MFKSNIHINVSLVIISAVLLLSGCWTKRQYQYEVEETIEVVEATQSEIITAKPKNVIFLIGDGMGLSQISALHQEQDNLSAFSRFKQIGLMNVSSSSHKITDSAAGATAFSTGYKSFNGSIGVDSDTLAQPTILELYAEKGYVTGLVATSSITHATPAAFYAHTASRENHDEIAKQLLNSNVNYFAGGGKSFFRSPDVQPLMENWIIDTTQLGETISPSGETRFGFLLADDGMPKMSEGRGTFCADATLLGIDYLKEDAEGFFMMIEGSQIDWGGHANDYEYVYTELIDFENVTNLVLDYAEKDGNTLVVVTADHETGGMALVPGKHTREDGTVVNDYDKVDAVFSTGSHSATLIPVFAFGPGAENFNGIYQNTDIFHKLKDLMND